MNQAQVSVIQNTPTMPMIRALGGVGLICALFISLTYQFTLPIIEKKKAIYLQEAVYRTIPGAVASKTFVINADHQIVPPEGVSDPLQVFYAGYDEQGHLAGLALEARGLGFQDVIVLLYGYQPETQTLIGFQVLESKETPGLGDKIEKEPFINNIKGLDVSLNEAGAIAHPIELVAPGSKNQNWQIDSISGATITSKAIGKMLLQHSSQWIPILHRQRLVYQEQTP